MSRRGRGASSTEIRAELDRTRASLDRAFDALGSKLTPSRLLWDGIGVFRDGASAGISRAMQMAQEHPLPASVIGLGVGWLLLENARSGRRGGTYPGTPAEQSHGHASGRHGTYPGTPAEAEEFIGGGSVEEVAGRARGRVTETAEAVKEKATRAAESVKDQASRAGQQARQTAQRAGGELDRLLREQPLVVGLGAMAVGVLAGLLLPATRREDEVMGAMRDRKLDRAREAARETLEKGKRVARTAVESAAQTAKEEAERQQLTPRAVAERVVGGG